jgi:hypothetical protein
VDHVPEVTSAAALTKASWEYIRSRAYPSLRLGFGSFVLVWGPPGGGKSTYVLRAMNGMDGAVVLHSIEESAGPTVAERLVRAEVTRSDFVIVGRSSVDTVAGIVRERKAVALAVDSFQLAAYTADELRHLLLVLPSLRCLFVVSQVNKEGQIEGRNRLLHECDIAIQCESMRWKVTRSRYQAEGEGGSILETRDASTGPPKTGQVLRLVRPSKPEDT